VIQGWQRSKLLRGKKNWTHIAMKKAPDATVTELLASLTQRLGGAPIAFRIQIPPRSDAFFLTMHRPTGGVVTACLWTNTFRLHHVH